MDPYNHSTPTSIKLPILDTGKFEQWKLRIQQYLQHEHYALWEVIEFGDSYKVPPEEIGKGVTGEDSAKKKGRTVAITVEDMQKRRNDVNARTTLLLALLDEHQLRFSKYETAKELWEAILKTFGGNKATKKTKKNQLKQQYGNFKAEGSETLEQTSNRLQAIVSHLEFMDVPIEQDDLNQKFLSSLAPEWLVYTIVWRNRDDLDTMSLDDVYNHLKVYEPEVQKSAGSNSQNMAFISSSNTNSGKYEVPTVQGVSTTSAQTASVQVSTASTDVAAASLSYDTVCAFIATQPNGSQIKYEDITQIDDDDIEEMDIKWNLALLSMRADRFWKKTGKKITIQGSDVAGFDKSKVECFNCHKMGHFARECRSPRSQDRGKKESYKKDPKVEEPAPKAMIAIDGIGWDWSYMAEEDENHALVADEEEVPTEYALMAKSSSSSDNEVYDDSFCSKSCRKNTENLNNKIIKLNEELSDCETDLYNYKRGLSQVEARLVEFKKNEIKFCERIRVLERDLELRDNKIENLRNELEEVKKEKECIDFKIEKFDNASKDLDSLLGNQRLVIDKKGLGFNEYNTVPPPPAQVYSPPKKDLSWMGLPEFVDDTVTDYSRPTPSIDVSKDVSDDQKAIWKRNSASSSEQVGSFDNVVSKPMIRFVKETGCPSVSKVNNTENSRKPTVKYAEMYRNTSQSPKVMSSNFGPPIIEDWDSEDESEVNFTLNKTVRPSIEQVKFDKSTREVVGEKETPKQNKIPTAKPTVAADKGNKGKAIKASACWIWKPKQNQPDQGSNLNGVSGISQDNIDNKGYYDSVCSRHMTGNISYLSEKDFKLVDDTHVLLRTPRQQNMYSIDLKNIVPHKNLTCLIAKAFEDESMLWHKRLGHLNFKTMNKLVRNNLVKVNSVSKPLYTLHMDLFGPTSVSSLNHKWYCLVVTNDFSRFTWTFFLKSKDETFRILRNFITEIENLKDLKVKIIRCDNGGEFRNKEMDEFCSRKGIKREFSNARTPQQNGVAKRRNRTLIEAARTMLADDKLPITFWAEAVNTACYVQNRVLVIKPHNKTPYELFNERSPAIGFLRPFGCNIMILNTLDHLGKFDVKGDEGYFVGYSLSNKAFRVVNKRTKKVDENLHVNFLENQPIEKRTSPNWLFDIDTLTKSMNYVPVVVAGTPSTNFSCTKEDANQAMKENVSSLRFIALPNWFHEDQMATSNDFTRNSDAFSEKDDSQKEQDRIISNTDVSESSGNTNPTAITKVPTADQVEPVLSSTVETEVLTVSSPVPPISPTPTLRIHKVHPKSQIISLVDTPVQTRQKTKNMEEQSFIATIHQKTNPELLQYCLFSCFLSQEEPKKIFDALKDPSWVEAMQEELLQFKIQNVWVLVDCPNVMDVKSAFLYGTIDEEVYVMQPPGFQDSQFSDKVYKVVKAMYGLHQAPRAWYGTLSKYLLDNGFQRGTIDQTLFIRKHKGEFLLVQVYVDDIIFGSSNPRLCREFEALMHEKFKMSVMGELNFFLGLQVLQKKDGIFLSQDKYVVDILKKFGYTDIRSANTPIDRENHWGKDGTGKDVELYLYRSMIGSLMYLTASRPDIMFVVCACARHQVTPKECHLHAVKRIFRYLKGHPKLGIWYPKESSFDLVAYSDIDYGGANQDRKSTTRDDNVADLLTKAFNVGRFQYLVDEHVMMRVKEPLGLGYS
ncbi:putative ribonuclease H-like domain-containing protein [Tanacetum coccineum]|uniref:Ribonuclease H-like domain-containing protein n=1 Tax=Tanacetum coccineum TaxID=301880 RepID=A0ABQ5D1Q9_9ASTR